MFLEPVSSAIHAGENCVNPALMLGTKLAEGSGCHYDAFDYDVYYDYWECPRILMEAEVRRLRKKLSLLIITVRGFQANETRCSNVAAAVQQRWK